MHQTEDVARCHFCGLETHEPRMVVSGKVYCPNCLHQAHPEFRRCDDCLCWAEVMRVGMMTLCQECIERGTRSAIEKMVGQALSALPPAIEREDHRCLQCGDTGACRHKQAALILWVAQIGRTLLPQELGLIRELFSPEVAA